MASGFEFRFPLLVRTFALGSLAPELLEQGPLRFAELRRGRHLDVDEFVSRLFRSEILHAAIADFKNLVWLSSFRDFDGNLPIYRGNVDGAPQGAIDEGKRNVEMDVIPVPPEIGVRVDDDFDIKIPVRPSVDAAAALPGQADLLPVVDACRHVDGQILADSRITLAAANRAGFLDDFSASAAMGARCAALHGPENRALFLGDVTASPAIRARSQIRRGIGTAAPAMGARLIVGYGNRDFLPADRIHERNSITGQIVLPFHRAGLRGRSLRAASEKAGENVVQIDVAEALRGKTGSKGTRPSGGTALLESSMAETIVSASLLVVA